MGALARFEAFVESLVEGPFARLLGGTVQPVQIAKLIQREMETKQTVGPNRVFAPNRFEVSLNPEDYAEMAPAAPALVRELVAYAHNLASERDLSFRGPVSVSLQPNPSVSRRQIRVESETTAASAPADDLPQTEMPPLERTQAISTARTRAAVAAALKAELVVGDGSEDRAVPLEHEVMTLGRSLDNDLVIEHASVSRHHAEIRYQFGRFALTDLQSTNGTVVNGRRVAASFLQDGDRIRLGDIDLLFRIVGGRES